jgi:hypothetical protein
VNRRTKILLGTISSVIVAAVAIWQGYLPIAKEKGWCPYSTSVNVRIIAVQFDAPGNDDVNNLNGEWVKIKNRGNTAEDMSGWILCDYGNNHEYKFRDFTLPAGETVTVFTGSGINSQTQLYWESWRHIWNNDGDTATLLDSNGTIVDDWKE